jgi:hypothetical protein
MALASRSRRHRQATRLDKISVELFEFSCDRIGGLGSSDGRFAADSERIDEIPERGAGLMAGASASYSAPATWQMPVKEATDQCFINFRELEMSPIEPTREVFAADISFDRPRRVPPFSQMLNIGLTMSTQCSNGQPLTQNLSIARTNEIDHDDSPSR